MQASLGIGRILSTSLVRVFILRPELKHSSEGSHDEVEELIPTEITTFRLNRQCSVSAGFPQNPCIYHESVCNGDFFIA